MHWMEREFSVGLCINQNHQARARTLVLLETKNGGHNAGSGGGESMRAESNRLERHGQHCSTRTGADTLFRNISMYGCVKSHDKPDDKARQSTPLRMCQYILLTELLWIW